MEKNAFFLTLSYVSEQYSDLNKKQKAFFVKRPEDPEDPEKDKLRMLRCDPEKFKRCIDIIMNTKYKLYNVICNIIQLKSNN